MKDLPSGLNHIPACLDHAQQKMLLECIRNVAAEAPLFVPCMPKTGKPMSVKMTNCGTLGWVTDKDRGYRYQTTHPVSGKPWPPIPEILLGLWQKHANYDKPPEACLVNYYAGNARMGLHQDRDEQNLEAPVLSVSLGDTCLFRYGGHNRNDPTRSIKLDSGDVILLSGESRMIFLAWTEFTPALRRY